MIVAGSITLAAAPAALRAVLDDPERLSRALPNVDRFGWTEGPVEGLLRRHDPPGAGAG